MSEKTVGERARDLKHSLSSLFGDVVAHVIPKRSPGGALAAYEVHLARELTDAEKQNFPGNNAEDGRPIVALAPGHCESHKTGCKGCGRQPG